MEKKSNYDKTYRGFEGTISSDRTKEFLVDLAKTGLCDSVYLDVIRDRWNNKTKSPTIFDDCKTNGIEVRVYFAMKRRDTENEPRLPENPVVKKFVEKYGLFMK